MARELRQQQAAAREQAGRPQEREQEQELRGRVPQQGQERVRGRQPEP